MTKAEKKLQIYRYQRTLEERRGKNFEYWNKKHDILIDEKGWSVINFARQNRLFVSESTSSVELALEKVHELRSQNNFARIVCGYDKIMTRQKRYSVIFKPKKKKQNADTDQAYLY